MFISFVDGVDKGTLPQDLKDVPAGDHKIRFAGNGSTYEPMEKNITVRPGETTDLGDVKLKVLSGQVAINSAPPGATIFLSSGSDRRKITSVPITIKNVDASKTWTLEATKAGFNDFHETVSFDDGNAEKTFNINMDPKGGGGAVAASPSPAAAPAPAGEPGLPPVPHIPSPAAGTPNAAVAVAKPAPAAAAGQAFLKLNSKPASNVILDGKPLGQTPQMNIPVTPGTHTITFLKPEENLRKNASVTVAAGETKLVIQNLRE